MKLSNKKVLLAAGVGLYVVAYKAGKQDAIDAMRGRIEEIEKASENIGYLRAINDMIEAGKRHKK